MADRRIPGPRQRHLSASQMSLIVFVIGACLGSILTLVVVWW